jgi:hypothetical protein
LIEVLGLFFNHEGAKDTIDLLGAGARNLKSIQKASAVLIIEKSNDRN